MNRTQPLTHFNIDDNLYEAYGRCIAYFSHLEDSIAMQCFDYLPINEQGQRVNGMPQLRYRLLFSKISFGDMLDIYKRILLELYPLKIADIKTLTNKLKKAGELRNSLVHGQLASDHLIYFARSGTANIQSMNLDELKSIYTNFLDLYDEVLWFQQNYLER